MKKIKRWNILFVSCMLLLVGIKVAAASPYQYISEIPTFIQISLLVNIFLLTLAIASLIEVKNISHSKMWNNVIRADIFAIFTSIGLAVLLSKLYLNTDLFFIYLLIAIFYSFAVLFDFIWHYLMLKPIIKKKLKLLKIKYISLFIFFIAMAQTFVILLSQPIPPFLHIELVYGYALLAIFINVYIVYIAYSLSKGFSIKGFVHIPYLYGLTGLIPLVLHTILLIYCIRSVIPANFYLIFFWLISVSFAVIYYGSFAIEYPSLLEPKWKALLPFDLPKVAAAITLAFLALSLYFTVKEYPLIIIYQNIPYIFVIAFLLPVFFGTVLIFTYLNAVSAKTKLKYWEYLKYGLYLHIIVTLYVFSLIFLAWNDATSSTKLLCAVFGLVAFAFYLFFVLDLRTLLKDQNIKPIFDRSDFPLYLVFFYSIFSIIFLGISFTYGKISAFVGLEFISYPAILFFVVFFFIAFGAYLSITHKGFEEIMRKNIWSELSYIFAFIVFLLVYLIYTSLSTYLQRFPYHNFVFIGYLAVLIIDMASTSTLTEKFEYKKAEKADIGHLLNLYAHNYLRTDYLEDLWDKALDRYVTEDEVKKIGFDPSRRRFDLEKTDEKTRLTIAVSILLGMHKLPNVEEVTILRKSMEETEEEIMDILKEKILMLPEDLRSEFDESVYNPLLLEKAINDLLTHLKTFIPDTEHNMIFERLKRRDELFNCINFENEEISIKKGTRFNRDDFLRLFRLYIEAIGEEFPFKRCLLHGLVKGEVKKELQNITVSDVLDIVPTGLKEMDKVMEGGLAKGSTTLLIAEETKAKQKMLISFIKQGLIAGNSTMYATSKRPFQQIVGELLMDIEAVKNFVIIDLYEAIHTEERVTEVVEEENRIIVPFSKILFQRSIVKTIKSKPRDVPKIVIVDVYDEFSRYFDTKEINELLQQQIEGLKRWNCTSIIALNPYSYLTKKEGIEEVKKNFDNIIILSGGDKDSTVFIEKLYHGTPFGHISHLPW